MAAKFVVFIAFLALANAAMVRRDAPTQAESGLESDLKKDFDSLLQQISRLSSSYRHPLIEITDGSGTVVGRRQYRDTDNIYIASTTMIEEMQQDAIDCATRAVSMLNNNKDIAQFIAEEFDKKYNPSWNCIVGRDLSCYVTSERKHYALFSVGQVAILLFRSG